MRAVSGVFATVPLAAATASQSASPVTASTVASPLPPTRRLASAQSAGVMTTAGVWLYQRSSPMPVTVNSLPVIETVSPSRAPRSSAAPADSPISPSDIGASARSGVSLAWAASGARPKSATPARSSVPLTDARDCTIPMGVTDATPSACCHARTASSSRVEVAKLGDPFSGCCSTKRSPGRCSTAEMFCAASPPVSPDKNPTSRVMRATTAPMSRKRPRANRSSLQATNTMNLSRSRLLRELPF